MLLHSWAFDHLHYKVVDHSKVHHSIWLLLSKVGSSTTNWTKKRCNHMGDQQRYKFSISPPSWTIVNVCKLQTCHFVDLPHGISMVLCRQKKCHDLTFSITFKIWSGLWNKCWRFSDKHVLLMMLHVLIYQIVVKLMYLKMIQLSFRVHL
jgi:hypothetical protein